MTGGERARERGRDSENESKEAAIGQILYPQAQRQAGTQRGIQDEAPAFKQPTAGGENKSGSSVWHLTQEQLSGRGDLRVERQVGLKIGAERGLEEAANAKEADRSQSRDTDELPRAGRVAGLSSSSSTGSRVRQPGVHIPGRRLHTPAPEASCFLICLPNQVVMRIIEYI